MALELSFVNSNLQLLKEQLAQLNGSVELYHALGDQRGLSDHIPMIPLGLKETKEVPFHDPLYVMIALLFCLVLFNFSFCSSSLFRFICLTVIPRNVLNLFLNKLQDFIEDHYKEKGADFEEAIAEFADLRQVMQLKSKHCR